jgi:hypothetical protein
MIRNLSITCCAGVLGLMAAEAADAADLLRFTNGDQLHGVFEGIKTGPQVSWKREDLAAAVDFKTARVRHIILHQGRPRKSLESLSNIALVNGDRIPGIIAALDDEAVTLETTYAGSLRIPRNQVAMLAPSPLGGRVHYHGPFVEDEWLMSHASFPDGLPPPPAPAAGKKDEKKDENDAKTLVERWAFSGSAWYWQNKLSGTALIRKDTMPDRAILRFDLAWKNRLSLAIAFHADFARPQSAKDAGDDLDDEGFKRPIRFVPGDSTTLPILFGNSYVLHVFASHLMLYRTSVDADGEASIERVQVNSSNVRLGDTGKATVEIRSNRITGQISMFINDEFAAQWSETGEAFPEPSLVPQKGTGIGFVVQAENSAVRLSDIMVAEWNGMPDSARSLQVDDQDIVLLANGTDRFSGNVKSLTDGKVRLDARHGDFQFPLEEVAEIRFARNRLAKEPADSADDVIVRFSPLGRLTGRPLAGDASSIRILHPVAGEMDVQLDPAIMLDFQPSNNVIDDWNSEF